MRLAPMAVRLFAECGYAAVRIEDLAAAAAVSIGGFYKLFDSKDDCLLFAYEQVLGRGREAVAEALEKEPWSPRGIEAALRVLVAFCDSEPGAARLALVVMETAGTVGRAAHRESLREATELLRGIRGRSSGASIPPAYEEFAVVSTAWRLRRAIEDGEDLKSAAFYDELRGLLLGPHL